MSKARTGISVLSYLAGGVLVSVAFAWALAWRTDPQRDTISAGKAVAGELTVPPEIAESFGAMRETQHAAGRDEPDVRRSRFGVTRRTTFASLRFSGIVVDRWRFGFPLAAFERWDAAWEDSVARDVLDVGGSYAGWAVHPPRSLPRWLEPACVPARIPTRILWPGLAADSLMYGAVLWGVSSSVRGYRRLRRRGRGLCEACGYPRGTGAVCSECGRGMGGVTSQ